MKKSFYNASEYAAQLGISKRRVEALCAQGRIKGAQKLGAGALAPWMIPVNAPDPRMKPGRPPA